MNVFEGATSFIPKFKVHGGTSAENLALQNIQVRRVATGRRQVYVSVPCGAGNHVVLCGLTFLRNLFSVKVFGLDCMEM